MNLDVGLRRWSRKEMSATLWIGFSSAEPDEVLEEWVREHDLKEYSPEKMRPWFERVEKNLSIIWPMRPLPQTMATL